MPSRISQLAQQKKTSRSIYSVTAQMTVSTQKMTASVPARLILVLELEKPLPGNFRLREGSVELDGL